MTAAELLVIDSKLVKADTNQYGEGDVIVRISVFETVLSDQVMDIADEISLACDAQLVKDQKENKNAVAVLFFIINIRDNEAIYVPCSDQFGTDLVLNAKFQKANDDDGQLTDPPEYVSGELAMWDNGEGGSGVEVIVLPSVLSRKKQLMPAILESVENTPYSGNGYIADQIECMEFIDGIIECHGQVIGSYDEEEEESLSLDDHSSHDHAEEPSNPLSTAEVACNYPQFTTLCSLIEACDVDFEGTDTFTVFAPTDDAFAELDAAVGGLDNVDEDILCGILSFHVVAGEEIHSDDLSCSEKIEMSNGVNARVKCDKGIPYGIKGGGNDEAANFVDVDLVTTDGVIHTIDNVLFYPRVMDGSTTGDAVATMRGIDIP